MVLTIWHTGILLIVLLFNNESLRLLHYLTSGKWDDVLDIVVWALRQDA